MGLLLFAVLHSVLSRTCHTCHTNTLLTAVGAVSQSVPSPSPSHLVRTVPTDPSSPPDKKHIKKHLQHPSLSPPITTHHHQKHQKHQKHSLNTKLPFIRGTRKDRNIPPRPRTSARWPSLARLCNSLDGTVQYMGGWAPWVTVEEEAAALWCGCSLARRQLVT